MMEQRQIVNLWRRGGARVIVTLVQIMGSSYRRPGARLLLGADGSYAGTISGGCLEAEVVRRALWMTGNGAVIKRYSTAFDDTSDIAYGLGCGGTLDLLLEPVDTPEADALLQAMSRAQSGESFRVITFFPYSERKLRRLIFDEAGSVVFASDGLPQKKIDCAQGLVPGELYEGRFVEELKSPQRLIVFGAGDDAKPVVAMASMMGWQVIVSDGRSHLAIAARFPAADQVIVSEDSKVVEALGVGTDDAVVVMSHSYDQDRSLLTALLPLRPKYLGLLGARHRSSLLVSEAAEAANLSVAECCERIWAPIGFDLGGDGPEAIALAIVAEVQAVCTRKVGASRRLSSEDVQRYVSESPSSSQYEGACALDTAL